MNKKISPFNIGDTCVIETETDNLIGTLYWSDKKNFKFMLEVKDPFMYYHRVYFNDVRKTRKLEIVKYECFRSRDGKVTVRRSA